MTHSQNIAEFKKGFTCGSHLVESYCRLIAIELTLADIRPLKTHDVLSKLQHLAKTTAGLPHAGALHSRIVELRRAFNDIYVESHRGTITLPFASYPTIRYTRYSGDWPSYHTHVAKVESLNSVVKNTIVTLRALGRAV